MTKSAFIIDGETLQARLGDARLRIVDASWYLPAQNRDQRAEYAAGHIPGAVFFDQDAIVDASSALPHALPSPELFAEKVGALGISETDTIVVYDGPGLFSAPRVWWMFRTMGASSVLLLDGGLDRWKADGRPVTSETNTPEKAVFTPAFHASKVATIDDVRAVIDDGSAQIADARPHGRFTGEEPEPRAGMHSGHMPGAFNVPAASLGEGGSLKDLEALAETLKHAGVDPSKPVVTTCGSGVTAATITLALHSLGYTDNKLYDGSWSEWGARDDTPIKKGAGIIDDASSSPKE